MYLDGIDFAAPKSNLPGFVQHASVLDHLFRPMEHHARMGTERAGGLNRGPLLFGPNLKQSVSFEFALAFGMLHLTLVFFTNTKWCIDCLALPAVLTSFSAFTHMASMASEACTLGQFLASLRCSQSRS